MASREKIIIAGKYLFLAGVALLIIRNNSYPFLIKRSSDILFALSAVAALWVIFRFKTGYENFFKNKKVLWGISLIIAGLVIASVNGYFSEGSSFAEEGLLNIGRFAEVFAIVFLVSFFQNFDENFYKKAALAQLSTLVYLPMLLFPHAKFVLAMYRFNFLENWPSNVGYYLIASLTCIAVLALGKTEPFKKTFWVYYALGIGVSSVFLWAQSRAAWLGFALSVLLLIIFWAKRNVKKYVVGFSAAAFVFIPAFLPLRSDVQSMILGRIFPQSIHSPASENIGAPKINPESGLFAGPHRLELWKIYSEKLMNSSLGFGVDYKPVNVGFGEQGPHNTVLEFLVLAGPMGLAGFILLFFAAFKNSLTRIRNAAFQNRLWLAYLFSSLAGLAAAAMFDNMSLFRLMWLVLGLAVFV